jgi:hypothetical protein
MSQPITLDLQGAARNRRRWLRKRDGLVSVEMNNASGIDSYGPWFDGVTLLKAKKISEVDEVEVRKKSKFKQFDASERKNCADYPRNWHCRRWPCWDDVCCKCM